MRVKPLVVVAALFVGCAIPSPVQYSFLNTPPHRVSPRSWEQVEVFQGSLPPRSFVQIGTIDAPDSLENYSDADLIRYARAEAARHGCEALIVTSLVSRSAVTERIFTRTYVTRDTSSAHGFTCACIVYRD